jgi:hypothetical protein
MVSTSSVQRAEASRDEPLGKEHVPPGSGHGGCGMLTARILGRADPAWHAWSLRGQHGWLLKSMGVDTGSWCLKTGALPPNSSSSSVSPPYTVLARGRAGGACARKGGGAAQPPEKRSGRPALGGALRPAERRRSARTAERQGRSGWRSAGGSSRAAHRGGRAARAAARRQQLVCGCVLGAGRVRF